MKKMKMHTESEPFAAKKYKYINKREKPYGVFDLVKVKVDREGGRKGSLMSVVMAAGKKRVSYCILTQY